MIENWLLKNEEYDAPKNKNIFIGKSIKSISTVISGIRNNEPETGFLSKVNTVVKIISTLITIILIALTREYQFLVIINIFAFILLFTLKNDKRDRVLISSIIFPFFTVIILMPSIIKGNTYHSGLMIYKVFINILLVNIISASSKWQVMVQSLRVLFIPSIFIWIMELTLKYILLLGEYSLEVLKALKLKSIGKNKNTEKSLFKIMGNIFLNSIKMSEEMVAAMECRGFSGEYHKTNKIKLNYLDFIYIFITLVITILFILI